MDTIGGDVAKTQRGPPGRVAFRQHSNQPPAHTAPYEPHARRVRSREGNPEKKKKKEPQMNANERV
jgi:hypothetical protein